jgi:Tat protein secretion system quality control protein TatD with DNase activity
MPTFFDTHAHLDFPDFEADLPQVIERAQAAGIAKIISIGTDLDSSARAIKLAERFACVYAAVGWHPSHVTAAPADVRPALRELAKHPKVVALGETGLDYHRLPSMSGGGGGGGAHPLPPPPRQGASLRARRHRKMNITNEDKQSCFSNTWKLPPKLG